FGDVVLQAVGWPTDRTRGHAVLAARMNGDGQLVLLGGRIDRPKVATTEQTFPLRQHENRDETAITGEALNLIDGEVGRLHGHDHGGPQAGPMRRPWKQAFTCPSNASSKGSVSRPRARFAAVTWWLCGRANRSPS